MGYKGPIEGKFINFLSSHLVLSLLSLSRYMCIGELNSFYRDITLPLTRPRFLFEWGTGDFQTTFSCLFLFNYVLFRVFELKLYVSYPFNVLLLMGYWVTLRLRIYRKYPIALYPLHLLRKLLVIY